METAEEIWAGDLFKRRAEAEDLVGYLESVAARPPLREDGHAHVLAVDGRYGEGKTYFLRRFARHMSMTHPVAFVDAWVDDLEDEPLVALASTLELALEPYTSTDVTLADRVREFRDRAGRVSKIVAGGLLRRGVGLVITQAAAEALSDELKQGTDAEKDIKKDALKTGGQGLVDEATKALLETSTPSMDARIARFREGQAAIAAMKAGLAAVVSQLAELGIKTPITIVIDELDRCRPTYAIKLLEEVKHLFDVPGVAFVLGMHAGQLTHSVSAAYGTGFDAQSYLRRFFNRRYTLRPVGLDALIQILLRELLIPVNRLAYPRVQRPSARPIQVPPETLIADGIRAYGLTARDTFEFMETLQTALALCAPAPLELSYLIPLIVQQMKGLDNLPDMVGEPGWHFAFSTDPFGNKFTDIHWATLVTEVHRAVDMPRQELMNAYNSEHASLAIKLVGENRFNNDHSAPQTIFSNYATLLRTVKRFSSGLTEEQAEV